VTWRSSRETEGGEDKTVSEREGESDQRSPEDYLTTRGCQNLSEAEAPWTCKRLARKINHKTKVKRTADQS